jgi:hypothetical protein
MEIFRDLIEIFFLLHENIFSLIRNDINRLLELLLDYSQHKLERNNETTNGLAQTNDFF